MSQTLHGSCLCGRVKFEIAGPITAFYACHCGRCRKASGSAHGMNIFVGPDSVRWIAGEDLVTNFALSDASYFNAAFCRVCGSPAPRKARSGDFEIVPAGSLDDSPLQPPDRTIFWDDRASWFDAACEAPRFAGYG
jgi:hypothetical protein